MKNIEGLINEDGERLAIYDFLNSRWEGHNSKDLKDIVDLVWNKTMEARKHVFSPYFATDIVSDWSEKRKQSDKWKKNTQYSKKDIETVISYDYLSISLMKLIMNTSRVVDFLNEQFDYEKTSKNITSLIRQAFPESSKMKPEGWKELNKNYDGFNSMEQYASKQKEDYKDFTGSYVSHPAVHHFVVRVSLPHVMYDDKEQGRKPLQVLVGAIMTHAILVREHNNSHLLSEELKSLQEKFDHEDYYKEIIYKIDWNKETKNSLLALLLTLNNQVTELTEESFKEKINNALESAKKFETLTEKQKEEHKKQFVEQMKKMFGSKSSQEQKEEDIARKKRQEDLNLTLIQLFHSLEEKENKIKKPKLK